MDRRKAKPFRGIRRKVFLVILVATIVALLSYFLFFWIYTYQASVERYEEQLVPLRDALENNIDFYVSTCVKAARSIYYDVETLELLADTGGNFFNSEAKDSQALFSYMLSVYASIPSAKQIRLSAYALERSFLITTDDLVRYMDVRRGSTFATEYPDRLAARIDRSIWVESSHIMGNYGHFVSQAGKRSQHVFTVHIPIYKLPNSMRIMGLLSVDISTQYIEENCNFARDANATVYIADDKGSLVYATDRSLIGQPLVPEETGRPDWLQENIPDVGSYTAGGYLVTTRAFDSQFCPWRLYITTPLRYITRDALTSQFVLMWAFIAYVAVITVLLLLILFRSMNPLNRIAMFIQANSYGGSYNLKARLSDIIRYGANDEVGVLVKSVDSMLDTIDSFMVRQYQMLLANRTSELRTLQAQINPHFIYNTLQCIASKTLEHGDAESYTYIASFGQLLQYAMDVDESVVTLEREAEHMKRYLLMQSVRFDCPLSLDMDVDPKYLKAMIPKMGLQPLAENSVNHGRLYERKNGRICLRAVEDGECLLLEVTDNGVPIDAQCAKQQMEKIRRLRDDYEHLRDLSAAHDPGKRMLPVEHEAQTAAPAADAHHGIHIGLTNVFLRYMLRFGPACSLTAEPNGMGGTTIRLRIPCEKISFEETGEWGRVE